MEKQSFYGNHNLSLHRFTHRQGDLPPKMELHADEKIFRSLAVLMNIAKDTGHLATDLQEFSSALDTLLVPDHAAGRKLRK